MSVEPEKTIAASEAGETPVSPASQVADEAVPAAAPVEPEASHEEEDAEEAEVEHYLGDAKPLEFIDESSEPEPEKKWYILKVQSNREDSIREALLRKVRIAGLERYFGEILVPTEDIAEFKGGKRRVVKRKLYPGYLVAYMAINDESWFVVRETAGIGDFTGSGGRPAPMLQHEIDKILRATKSKDEGNEGVKTTISFKLADRVRVKDGNFQNFEGEVDAIDEANGRVTVMINIFGRSTPVEFEHWQLESM